MQKIVIVGGTQGVGAEVARRMAESGHEVVAQEDLLPDEQELVQVEIQRQEQPRELSSAVQWMMGMAAMADPKVAKALSSIHKRNQEALRPKTEQELTQKAASTAKQDVKRARREEDRQRTLAEQQARRNS